MDPTSLASSILKEFKEVILSSKIIVIALCLGLAGLLLLFLPDNVLDSFYMLNRRDQYIETIGIGTFFSLVFALFGLVYYCISWIARKTKNKKTARQYNESQIEILEELTPVECFYLAQYYVNDTPTSNFQVQDGVASGLVSKGVLYYPVNTAPGHAFPHNIQPWAIKTIRSNPDIIIIKATQYIEYLDANK